MDATILITFDCGHSQYLTGTETSLICHTCGSPAPVRIEAPPPSFVGHARGPHAEYKDLPAQAVTLGATDE